MSKLVQILKRMRGDALVRQVAARSELQAARLTELIEAQNKTLSELKSQIARLEKKLEPPAPAAAGPTLIRSTDTESWSSVAQEGELGFHKRPNMRSDAAWSANVAKDWQELGFEADAWKGKTVIDVGAGSRLRTLYFEGATLIALEPLAERYAAEVEWQDIDQADEMYAVPAEKLVPALVGRADLIVSINALDHGYDFETGIHNLRSYVKDDGEVFLSFDQHEVPDSMHPLVLNDAIVRDIFERAGFAIEKTSERKRYHGAQGPCALNYWLRPAPTEA